MDLHYDHPILMLQHMIWHEGYITVQIAQDCGPPAAFPEFDDVERDIKPTHLLSAAQVVPFNVHDKEISPRRDLRAAAHHADPSATAISATMTISRLFILVKRRTWHLLNMGAYAAAGSCVKLGGQTIL